MSSGSLPPDLGDTWRYGCLKSLDWDNDVDSIEKEDTSSSELREPNVESTALHVIGQNWSGDKISLFLKD